MHKISIYLTIGYAPTREEGNIMLALYNNDPYDVDAVKVTLKQLWELFKEKKLSPLVAAKGFFFLIDYLLQHIINFYFSCFVIKLILQDYLYSLIVISILLD